MKTRCVISKIWRLASCPIWVGRFHTSAWCEFSRNGRRPNLVGLEAWRRLPNLGSRAGENLGFGADFVEIHTESRGQSRIGLGVGGHISADWVRGRRLTESGQISISKSDVILQYEATSYGGTYHSCSCNRSCTSYRAGGTIPLRPHCASMT